MNRGINAPLISLYLVMLVVSGCTADLGVYDASERKVPGFPVAAPVVYVVTGAHTKHSKLGDGCTPAPFYRFQTLPTGERFFVDPETGPLANSEFGLKFSATGSLTELTLNSESTAPQTLDSATNLLTAVGNLAGLGVATALPAERAAPGLPACDTGESNIKLQRISELIQ